MGKKRIHRPRVGDVVEIHGCIEKGLSDHDTIYGILLRKPHAASYSYTVFSRYYLVYLPEEQGVTKERHKAWIDKVRPKEDKYNSFSFPSKQYVPFPKEYAYDIIFNNSEKDEYEIRIDDLVFDRLYPQWAMVRDKQYVAVKVQFDNAYGMDRIAMVDNRIDSYLTMGEWVFVRLRRDLIKLSRRTIKNKTIASAVVTKQDILKTLLQKRKEAVK